MSNIVQEVYKDEDIKFDLEFLEGIVFIHLKVFKFNKSSYLKIKEIFEEIKNSLYLEGFDELYCYTQNKRFVKRMSDGKEAGSFYHLNNFYEVLRWDLKF